ncbi:MAG: fluoride efflux transporter CrcB [Bacillus sp. (in: Bacteria)]|nr:fluoride efflux transporter CrcB [Bacillus sp. (in: firmicutes)]
MVYLLVGIGGVFGSLLRYLSSIFVMYLWGGGFPIGTLLINLTGSFLLGLVISQLVIPNKLPSIFLTALTTGVIGSYTTFSTFSYETVYLLESKEYLLGFLYMFISIVGGLFFIRVGMRVRKQEKKASRRIT